VGQGAKVVNSACVCLEKYGFTAAVERAGVAFAVRRWDVSERLLGACSTAIVVGTLRARLHEDSFTAASSTTASDHLMSNTHNFVELVLSLELTLSRQIIKNLKENNTFFL